MAFPVDRHLRPRRAHVCPTGHRRCDRSVHSPPPHHHPTIALAGWSFECRLTIPSGYVLTYGSVPIGDADPAKRDKAALQDQAEKDAALERVRSRSHGPGGGGGSGNKPLSGWLTVRRQFQPIAQSSSIFTSNSPTTDLTGAELPDDDINGDKDKEGDNGSNSKDDTNSVKSGSSTPTPAPATYSARIAQTYRQMVEARQSKKDSPPKEFFWCVLKGSVLFLYEDEAQSECIAAIGVDKYMVGVETSEGGKFTGKDAEMFAKRNACVLRILEKEKTNGGNGHGNGEGKEGLPVLAKGMEAGAVAGGGEKADEEREMENAPWFLFSKSNTKQVQSPCGSSVLTGVGWKIGILPLYRHRHFDPLQPMFLRLLTCKRWSIRLILNQIQYPCGGSMPCWVGFSLVYTGQKHWNKYVLVFFGGP